MEVGQILQLGEGGGDGAIEVVSGEDEATQIGQIGPLLRDLVLQRVVVERDKLKQAVRGPLARQRAAY